MTFIGFWYISVDTEDNLNTTIANSTDARTAFMKGNHLPPDEMVKFVYKPSWRTACAYINEMPSG